MEQAPTDEPIENTLPYFRALVVGVGGGGCNAVTHIARKWKGGPDLVSVNTDLQALAACDGTHQISIGRKVTEGLGAGGDAELGRLAAEADKEILRDLVFDVNLVIIVTGLGGGTGTGAAPVLGQIAREEGAMTLCLATMPFAFEGEQKTNRANDGLKQLAGHCDVVVRLANDDLVAKKKDEKANLQEAFELTDDLLGMALRAIYGVISQTGVINLDFADIRQIVESSGGLCSFGYGEASGARKAQRAAKAALKHPLLAAQGGVHEAEAVLVNIIGGTELTLTDVQTVMNEIKPIARTDAQVLMGAVIHESWSSKLAVTLMVPLGGGGPARARPSTADTLELPMASSGTAPGDAPMLGDAGRPRAMQTNLNFETSDKGRFKNVEPTIYEGEDLDIPTFVRRGIRLSGER